MVGHQGSVKRRKDPTEKDWVFGGGATKLAAAAGQPGFGSAHHTPKGTFFCFTVITQIRFPRLLSLPFPCCLAAGDVFSRATSTRAQATFDAVVDFSTRTLPEMKQARPQIFGERFFRISRRTLVSGLNFLFK